MGEGLWGEGFRDYILQSSITELAAFQAYRFKTSPQPRCVICVVSQLKAASSSSNSDDERRLEFGLVLEKLHERSGAATGV
jgi:hypothetical protein